MESFTLLLCLFGLVAGVPVDQLLPIEEPEVAGLAIEQVPGVDAAVESQEIAEVKENKRFIRQHDPSEILVAANNLLYARNPMEAYGGQTVYTPECSQYYAKTHAMPVLNSLNALASAYNTATAPIVPASVSAAADLNSAAFMPQTGGYRQGPYYDRLQAPYPHEAQPNEQHQAHTYFTTVPYISGYRMSPIYSEKQIVVKDFAHPEMQPHSGVMIHSHGQYGRSADEMISASDSMLNGGNDFQIIFGQPLAPLPAVAG